MKNASPKRRNLLMCLWAAAIALGFDCSAYPQSAPAKSTTGSSIVYVNKQYGFRFDLPASWKGYTVLTEQQSGSYTSDPEKRESYTEISIRHPLWKEDDRRQDIPIMIFTHSQWNLVEQEKLNVSAAPFPPSKLGENSRYVFALPPRYNYGLETGFEEVEKIFDSKPLHPF
jgi:hypothetical protein